MDGTGNKAFLEANIPRYLAHAPLALCIRELNRLLALRWVEDRYGRMAGPILDVGCGDGFWWTCLDRDGREVYGVDIAEREIAQARRVLDSAERTDISATRPFPGTSFRGLIGNCSLEHVPDIDGALRNLARCADVGARLVLFVPTPTWAHQGRTQGLLMRRSPRIAMAIAGAMNGFFQHWHVYDRRVWFSILSANGWKVEGVHGLGGKRSEFLFRLFLPTGFVAFLAKKITGHYPNKLLRWIPAAFLAPFVRMINRALEDSLVGADDGVAYEYVIVAQAEGRP